MNRSRDTIKLSMTTISWVWNHRNFAIILHDSKTKTCAVRFPSSTDAIWNIKACHVPNCLLSKRPLCFPPSDLSHQRTPNYELSNEYWTLKTEQWNEPWTTCMWSIKDLDRGDDCPYDHTTPTFVLWVPNRILERIYQWNPQKILCSLKAKETETKTHKKLKTVWKSPQKEIVFNETM